MAKQPLTLQEWMDRNGVNDAGLAEKIGHQLSRSQVNRIRRGLCRPSVDGARALEAATKIPAARFVMGEAG